MLANVENLPKRCGKYDLIERIGAGGMAELFRAKIVGEAGFEKYLAVKKVLPHLSQDEEFIRMFKDEANISASLNHGNIISVIDFVRLHHEYYLVMEYVDGVSLIDLIDCVAEDGKFLPAAIAQNLRKLAKLRPKTVQTEALA